MRRREEWLPSLVCPQGYCRRHRTRLTGPLAFYPIRPSRTTSPRAGPGGPTSCGAGVTKKSGPRIRSGATAVVFISPEPNRAFRPRPYCRRLQSVYWSYESFRHRTRSGNSMSDHLALGGVIAILVLTAAAVAFSLHRNSILIESFDQPDLTELRVCLSDHRMEWARAKLGERGWDLIDAKSEAAWKGKSHVLFRRRANGEPIKCILHFLNRSLQLPIGKWDFNRSN